MSAESSIPRVQLSIRDWLDTWLGGAELRKLKNMKHRSLINNVINLGVYCCLVKNHLEIVDI